MKNLNSIISLLFLLTLSISCENDDDNTNPPPTNNKFTINGTDYQTPFATLIFDDSSPYGDAFFLNFLVGTLRKDNVNGISVSTNMKQGVVLFIELCTANVLNEQDINIVNNTTYPLEKGNSLALTNVTAFFDTYTYNGVMYG